MSAHFIRFLDRLLEPYSDLEPINPQGGPESSLAKALGGALVHSSILPEKGASSIPHVAESTPP